ncbi:MAG: aldehyde dehydrogenase family protein [Kofleriaceae bacterium]|jgi:malonate-semialdehyde dehydrogenase (acetylating)/methylmalonate-semialdehyde dehydrogenase|nr:aldehyde dehydrogenase family protein [Kofleriaceae bacterium]MBP9168754.1 aldehyde dehydrogenase family protein [Kofleriaceae bacterium]
MAPNLPTTPYVCHNLIAGQWRPSAGGDREVRSPYTGGLIGTVPMSTAEDVDAAVAAATTAAAAWRRVPIKERAAVLFRFRDQVLAAADELGHAAAAESGKTVAEGRAGVLKGVEVVEYALSLQNLDSGGALEVSRGVTCELRREPLGVVGGIVPFNFPAMVPFWMFPIAIATGNAFVLKPSEKVPITMCKVAELWRAAGLPDGVFSLVHGGRETVDALVEHPGIAAVGFVGSSPVARSVYAKAALAGKRALCLGGAKNPIILAPDADPALAVPGIVDSFTGCAGQRCMAASLLIAVGDDPAVDRMIDAVVARAAGIKLGVDMGAIIDRAAVARLTAAVDRAQADGAVVRLDGRRPTPPAGAEGGNWFGPTILDRADPSWPCAVDELFGPIITIVRVKNLDAALALDAANAYGNACSVFTSSGAVARAVAERASAGMIGVNIGVPVPREPFAFGGTKGSRFGHGDITGAGGLEFWTQHKKITSKWALQQDATWMS